MRMASAIAQENKLRRRPGGGELPFAVMSKSGHGPRKRGSSDVWLYRAENRRGFHGLNLVNRADIKDIL